MEVLRPLHAQLPSPRTRHTNNALEPNQSSRPSEKQGKRTVTTGASRGRYVVLDGRYSLGATGCNCRGVRDSTDQLQFPLQSRRGALIRIRWGAPPAHLEGSPVCVCKLPSFGQAVVVALHPWPCCVLCEVEAHRPQGSFHNRGAPHERRRPFQAWCTMFTRLILVCIVLSLPVGSYLWQAIPCR